MHLLSISPPFGGKVPPAKPGVGGYSLAVSTLGVRQRTSRSVQVFLLVAVREVPGESREVAHYDDDCTSSRGQGRSQS